MKTPNIFLLIFFLLIGINSFSQDWENYIDVTSIGNVRLYASDMDNEKSLYTVGHFENSIGDSLSSNGNYDFFILKLDSLLNPKWLKNIGSQQREFVFIQTKIDKNNNLFVAGAFKDTCTFNGINDTLISAGINDVFLAKYDKNGNFHWTKNIASLPSSQWLTGLDVDENNDILITGYYKDSIKIENDTLRGVGLNSYFAKFDNSGTLIWTKNIISSTNYGKITSVKAFNDGYYLNGYFSGDLFLDVKTISSLDPGKGDVYLYKTNFDGDGLWVRQCYSSNDDYTGTIDKDDYGNVYYTGYFSGTNFIADSTDIEVSKKSLNPVGGDDIFIVKYNKTGNLLWLKSYGGLGNDAGKVIQSKKNILYVSGYFNDSIILGLDTLIANPIGDQDIFVSVIDDGGNSLQSYSLEGNGGSDHGDILEVIDERKVTVGGAFISPTLIIGDDVISNTSANYNGIIANLKLKFLSIFTATKEVSCPGQTDGELTVTPYFGVAPYTYSWSHNGALTDSTATGLAPSTYTVTVSDALDSTAVVSYDLTEPVAITFNPTITDVITCSYSAEGEIDLSMAGGNGGYLYQWQATDGGYGVALKAEDQTGLAVGTYNLTVTDSKGCTGDTAMNITGPDPITFGGSVVTDSSTSGAGAIDLLYTGGFGDPTSFTFDWQGPSGTVTHSEDTSNLSPGNYDVTVTDVHTCEFDTMFNVANLDTFYIYIAQSKDACNGTINGAATVEYNSPDNHTAISYQWGANSGNQTTAQAINLAPGIYHYVTVTDTENTPDIVLVDSIYIDELAYTFSGSLSGTSTLDCNGDNDGYLDLSITSEGERPYVYNWSNGATLQDLTGLGVGNYSVTVTDKNNCEISVTNYTIDQPTSVSAVAEIVSTPSCNGDFNGEITVERSGGTAPYTYQWDDPGFQNTRNADGVDASYYTVTVSDVNGCEATSGINLTEPEPIVISKTINNEVCNDAGEGAVSISITGGTTPFSYFWGTSNGSGLIATEKNQSGLTAGTYYVTITDDNNCSYEDSVKITEPPLLEITDETKTDVNTCNGESVGSISITATGGTGALTYTLNPGAIQSNATGTFLDLAAGNYTVDVTDENLCSVTSSSITINEPAALTLTENAVKDATCNGVDNGSVDLSVSGGTIASDYTYNWITSDGSGLVAGSQDQLTVGAGSYDLTVTDDNGCEVTASYTLTEPDTIIISKTVYDISCDGGNDGTIIVNHTGGVLPFSYFWTTTDGSGLEPANRNQGGLSTSTYTLEITDALGCVIIDDSQISSPLPIQIETESSTDATGENTSDGTVTVEASGGTGVLTYTLQPNNKSNQSGIFNSVAPGNYTVNVRDENYCGPVSSNTITVGYPNAIEGFYLNDLVKIYPNPTSNKITIEMDYIHKVRLEILSLTGALLYVKELKPDGFIKEEVDLSGNPKGIYLIRIFNKEIDYKTKVILQ